MATILQTDRAIEVTCPLGENVLLFHRMTANESLGRLFEFQLEVHSVDMSIALPDLLGESVTVRLNRPDGETR